MQIYIYMYTYNSRVELSINSLDHDLNRHLCRMITFTRAKVAKTKKYDKYCVG